MLQYGHLGGRRHGDTACCRTYTYDGEGNLVERVSKFAPRTLFVPDPDVTETLISVDAVFEDVQAGVYDLWTTWDQNNTLGNGTYTVYVQDDFTRANLPAGFYLRMLRDDATGMLVRTKDSSLGTDVPVNFAVLPRYDHDGSGSGPNWFHVGTVQTDSLSNLKLRMQGKDGDWAYKGFKLTPHIAKEEIDYDFANRPSRSKLYSENPAEPRLETLYAYDVLGHLAAVRTIDSAEQSTETTGYAYWGSQQVLAFGLNSGPGEFHKIKTMNLIGPDGTVLAVDPSFVGQPLPKSEDQQTVWQFNHLDGTKFTDSKEWLAAPYALAGKTLASATNDYLVQSRDGHRSTWEGKGETAWKAFSGSYSYYVNPANNLKSDSLAERAVGVVQVLAWIAAGGAGVAAGAVGGVAGLTAMGLSATSAAIASTGLAVSGATVSGASTYISNPDATFNDYALAVSTGGMAPISSLAGAAVGAAFSSTALLSGASSQTARAAYSADPVVSGGRPHACNRHGEGICGTALVRELSMSGSSKRENRQIPQFSQDSFFELWERSKTPRAIAADMYGGGKSDESAVPTKPANNDGTEPSAEPEPCGIQRRAIVCGTSGPKCDRTRQAG